MTFTDQLLELTCVTEVNSKREKDKDHQNPLGNTVFLTMDIRKDTLHLQVSDRVREPVTLYSYQKAKILEKISH